MTSQLLELEGTWEEILARSEKLAGRKVRVIVISEESLKPDEDGLSQEFHETTARETIPLAELWKRIEAEIKIMESLPASLQQQLAAYLQEYIADLKDELKWDESFQKTQQQLIAAARRAKQEIAEGKAREMKLDEL